MKKNRILPLILAALLLSGSMISCAEDTSEKESGQANTPQSPTNVDTTAEETEDIFEKDNLPDELDYGEATVTAMVWQSFDKSEFFVEEDTGEIV